MLSSPLVLLVPCFMGKVLAHIKARHNDSSPLLHRIRVVVQLWKIPQGFEAVPQFVIDYIWNGKIIPFSIRENIKQDFLHLHGDVFFSIGEVNLFRLISLKII